MKKNLILLCITLVINVLSSIYSFGQTFIADKNFAKAIKNDCYTCIDINNNLTSVADTVQSLNISNKGIESIEGIQAFKSLVTLNCSKNSIKILPSLPQNLANLYCDNNGLGLSSMPVLPQNLKKLYCMRIKS